MSINKTVLRNTIRGFYDIQKLRIQMGNRVVGNYKVKLGQEPGKPETELSDDSKKILEDLRKSYKSITEGCTKEPSFKKFKGDGVISDYTEFALIAEYFTQCEHEAAHEKRIRHIVESHPLWDGFLKDVRGVGAIMGAVMLSEIDIEKAQYPSSIWMYAGVDVAQDGRGRGRFAEHLVKRQYVDKNGENAERNGITFNPFLKTKLIGVLGSSFLRAGDNPYSKIYRDYKFRLENHEIHKEKTKGHRHNMAIRYMIKRFLVDLHMAWRQIEGLPVSDEYSVAKLGKIHKIA